MHRGFWLREAHSVVFYEVLPFRGDPGSNPFGKPSGSAKQEHEVPGRREWGEPGAELI